MGTPALKVGELSKRTGVTVRTIHYYQEIGLLSPSGRTDAGYRLYAQAELVRLQQIVSLRQLGFSLDEVRDWLDRPDYSPKQVIEMHIKRLREHIREQRRLCAQLETVAASLSEAEGVSVEQLLETIKEMTRMEKYYTVEQREEIRRREEALGEEGLRTAEAAWATLIDEVRAEMAKGTDPTSEPVQHLARRWMELVRGFTGGNSEIEKSLQRMWQRETTIHGLDTAEMREMGEYIGKALAAGGSSG